MVKKKNTNNIVILLLVVVLLFGVGAGGYFMWNSSLAKPTASFDEPHQSTQEAQVSYVNIAHPFLFNVSGDSRQRLVQINVQLMVRGESNVDLARYHLPMIESTLMSTFSATTVEQLRSANGRGELSTQASRDVKASLMALIGKPVIEKVLFTDFVIQ